MPGVALGPCLTVSPLSVSTELNEQRRRRLRKRHLKNAFANFIALFPSRLIRQMLGNFGGVEF